MRLSALVLASAFTWVFASGAALADSEESAATEFDVLADAAEIGSDQAPAVDTAAEEAPPAAEEAPVGWEEAAAEPVVTDAEAPGAGEALGVEGALAVEQAPAAPAAPVAESEPFGWDDFEDPAFDPSAPVLPADTPQTVVSNPAASTSSIPLGPLAVDENGVEGRIHTVAKGDTLWDISEAYLGTPWVWPSVWYENTGIQNPHVIEPGDRIWITSNEMRPVTEAEADQMIAAVYEEDEDTEIGFSDDEPLEFEDESLLAEEPLPASVEDESDLLVAMPVDPAVAMTGEIMTLPYEQTIHFASADTMRETPEIVDSPTLRAFLTQGDEVYIALGEGEVSPGDQFTVFRDIEKIRDIETRAVLGYHFDEMGWLEITSVEGESSTAIIKGAAGEMQRGDRLVPRIQKQREIPIRTAMDDVEGAIVFTPGNRWMMGTADAVYLNVGSIHGIEVGTQMEVYDAGMVKGGNKMPDSVVAQMVVISLEPETSVAFVTQTVRELVIGDHVRAVANDQFAVR